MVENTETLLNVIWCRFFYCRIIQKNGFYSYTRKLTRAWKSGVILVMTLSQNITIDRFLSLCCRPGLLHMTVVQMTLVRFLNTIIQTPLHIFRSQFDYNYIKTKGPNYKCNHNCMEMCNLHSTQWKIELNSDNLVEVSATVHPIHIHQGSAKLLGETT